MQPERPSLASVQRAMMALVTGRGGVDAASLTADALFVGDARGSADERIAVYAYMYRARMVEALESQFPRLAKHLGAEDFAALVGAYIDDEPSRNPSLRQVGRRLPGWLDAHRAADSMLCGLAALEWARTDVFDLVDQRILTLDQVRGWPVESFGAFPVRLIDAHRLVTVPAGTARLWDSVGADTARLPDAADERPECLECVIVWREDTSVFHRPVQAAERAALTLAAAGTAFGVICDSLLAAYGEDTAPAQAFAWMSSWLADGMLMAPDR